MDRRTLLGGLAGLAGAAVVGGTAVAVPPTNKPSRGPKPKPTPTPTPPRTYVKAFTDEVGMREYSIIVGPSIPGQQSAVSLVAVDGEIISGSTQSNFLGNGYWGRVGHTRARDWTGPKPGGGSYSGFDDVNFIPVSTWLTDYGGMSVAEAYSRMDDLGLNGMLPCSGAVTLANNITYGKWAVVPDESWASGSISSNDDPGVVGVSTGEEPSEVAQFDAIVAAAASWLGGADGAGRFHAFNFADQLMNGDIGNTYFPDDMVIATADQLTAMDQYWYAGASEPGSQSLSKLHARLYFDEFTASGAASQSQCERGSHYGSAMDSIRKAYASNARAPFTSWVEAAAPYSEAATQAMTPSMLKWAIWSQLTHGARMIGYFIHNFRTGDTWGSAFFDDHHGAPGIAGTGIYAAAKEINLNALSIAPVINSPFDGYFVYGDLTSGGAISTAGFLTAVTSTNSRTKYGGVDASCRWNPQDSKHYILSTTRETNGTTNWPVTFRMVDQGQTTAHPMFTGSDITVQRGGAIPGGFCEFSDTFANASDYKCYRID